MTTLSAPMTRIALITTLLVLAVAAPASAQSGAFGPLPPAQPTPTPAPTTTVDTGETGRNTLFIIGGALIIGFGIMGFLVLRDARRSAPKIVATSPVLPEAGAGVGARKAHSAAAKKKLRAKTRAQKQARKAHRR